MSKGQKIKVEIIAPSANTIFEERESGITHTSFELEYVLYQAIKNGNVTWVKQAIENYLKSGLVIGRLSKDNMRQLKYWAVSCISLAIHYSILGGMDETDAFNLSDQYIRHVDSLSAMEEIIYYLKEKAVELTNFVNEAKGKEWYSPAIRQSLHYINIHLHERLDVMTLAKKVGLSRDYFSTLFKKQVGTSVHAYIQHEKLEASKFLLYQGISYETISYNFGFCSETHYITCFKREYGMTPGQYRKMLYPE
ncbi:MAG: AraC family transcriptional regulator [Lachnospiraceae bacterium]|nr:AraC family transcriptional regulator [Lachnospiraceae bacterium]